MAKLCQLLHDKLAAASDLIDARTHRYHRTKEDPDIADVHSVPNWR